MAMLSPPLPERGSAIAAPKRPSSRTPHHLPTHSEQQGQTAHHAPLPGLPGLELLSELGRGGMGVVYQARQVSLNRLVAVKVLLHAAFASVEQRVRFQLEGEMAARVRHPHIVEIHEVASHQDCPYLVLEYVDGGTLAERLRDYPPRAAATLVATLARAMHAAHECGIIHRDLKPSNVLLTTEGIPKITDFGLARGSDQSAGLTMSGIVVGTPSYMSPEQARGQTDRIGPRTDVFALGVILYELLAGQLPFPGPASGQVVQQLLHIDPLPPGRLVKHLARDLEAVCLKALSKEPEDRYATAATLAADLEAYLDGRPVKARPATRWERSVKWTRRNPAAAALVVLAALLVSVVLPVMSVLYFQAEQARGVAVAMTAKASTAAENSRQEAARAEKEKRKAQAAEQAAEAEATNAKAITDFFSKHLIAAAAPHGVTDGNGSALTVRQALDQLSQDIERSFANPLVAAEVHATVGSAYLRLSELKLAEPQLRRAFDLRRRHLGPDALLTLRAQGRLARVHFDLGNHEKSLALSRERHARYSELYGPDDPLAIDALENVVAALLELHRYQEAEKLHAQLLMKYSAAGPEEAGLDLDRLLQLLTKEGQLCLNQGKFAEAEQLFRTCQAYCQESFGPKTEEWLHVQHCLATALLNQRRASEALVLLRDCHAGRVELLGSDHLLTLRTLNNLGGAFFTLDRMREAEAAFRDCLAGRLRKLNSDHPDVLETRGNLARCLADQHRFAEAEPLLEANVTAARRRYPSASLEVLSQLVGHSRFFAQQGNYTRAAELRREVHAGFSKIYGSDHNRTLTQLHEWAMMLYKQGDAEAAARLFGETYRLQAGRYGKDHSESLVSAMTWCGLLLELGRHAEAEPLVRYVWGKYEPRQDLRAVYRVEPQIYLGAILVEQGKLDLAEAEFAAAQAALDKEPVSVIHHALLVYRGEGHTKAQRWQDAEACLLKGWKLLGQLRGVPPTIMQQNARLLAALYLAQGDPTKAGPWQLRALPALPRPPGR